MLGDDLLNEYKKLDQSSMIEEEVSIAQEYSRLEEDLDIDEQPMVLQPLKLKINSTTECSISRANNMNSKVFECSLKSMSPSLIFSKAQSHLRS